MAKICPSCQIQNIDAARFCRHCGTLLPESQTGGQTQLNTAPVRDVFSSASTPFVSSAPPLVPRPSVYSAPDYAPIYPQPFVPIPMAPLAGFWIRFLAYFVDWIIPATLLIIGYFILAASGMDQNGPNPVGALALGVCGLAALAFVLFNIYLQGKNGATIGKNLAGLKCLDKDGLPLGFGRSLIRELVKYLIAQSCVVFLFIDNLWMLSDPEKQTLHDKIINSHVYKI